MQLPLRYSSGFGDGYTQKIDEYIPPAVYGANGSYPPVPFVFEWRPRFMWDVGASEQDITNVMEGIGGRGGYGSLSPPFMGYYGSEGCSTCGFSAANHVQVGGRRGTNRGFKMDAPGEGDFPWGLVLGVVGGIVLCSAIGYYMKKNSKVDG